MIRLRTAFWIVGSTCMFVMAKAAPMDSGIKGIVLAGPVQPSVRIGQPVPPGHPIQATLQVVRSDDHSVVATVQTRPNGTFTISLAPGDYVVGPPISAQIHHPSIEPVEVTVAPHTVVDITVNADSGLR